MLKPGDNPYLNARLYAGMTRLQAALALPSSETSIKEYELGQRNVPDDMALRMAKVYKAPWLRVQHLSKNPVFCDLFQGRLDVTAGVQQHEAVSALRLQKELSEAARQLPEINKKILDGTEIGSVVIKDLKEAAIAVINFVCFTKNSETAYAGTQAASVSGKK